MFNYFLSLSVSVPVSDAHVNVFSIVVFCSLNFSFFDMLLFLKTSACWVLLFHSIQIFHYCSNYKVF